VILILITNCARKKETESRKVTIRYENWEVYPEQINLHRNVVEAFNKKNPQINVKFEPIYGGNKKILIEIAGGVGPDVFYWCTGGILNVLVEKGVVLDLSSFIEESKDINLDNYFSGLFDAVNYEGRTYAFPLYWGTEAVAYNLDLFDKAGLSYPTDDWTWNDFLEIAKKLTIRNEEGKTIQFGVTRMSVGILMRSHGLSAFNPEGTRCIMDSPKIRKILQFLLDLEKKYRVLPALAELGGADKGKTQVQMFMTGRVAMFFARSFQLPTLEKIKSFRWDVAAIPRVKGKKRKCSLDAGCLCISTQSKYPQEAWEFIKFASGGEGQKLLGKNSIPVLKEVAYRNFCVPPPENIRMFIDQLIEYGEVIPRNPVRKKAWYNEFEGKVFYPELEKLFYGYQNIDQTVENIVKKGNEFLKQK